MECQKELFDLDPGAIYLNGAYMSPQLRSVTAAGHRAILRKSTPSQLKASDFFDGVDEVRGLFAQLIQADEENRIIIVPSTSYGMASVAQNIPRSRGRVILTIGDEFPSDIYAWSPLLEEGHFSLKTVKRQTGISYTETLIDQIDSDTAVVMVCPVHWGDGTTLDLEAIGQAARRYDALFVVDGTQSLGVLPFDQSKVHADVIIASAYKWLLGPYGIGCAYMGLAFDGGRPIEQSWLNRIESDDFQHLTKYQDEYRPGARRYEVGESPDFIKIPMLKAALQQLLMWTPVASQEYCRALMVPIMQDLQTAGYKFLSEGELSYHLLGITPPEHVDLSEIQRTLSTKGITISLRQSYLRVSPNVYNTIEDVNELKNALLDLALNRV